MDMGYEVSIPSGVNNLHLGLQSKNGKEKIILM